MSTSIGLDGHLGIDVVEASGDRAVLTFTIGDQHLQPFGLPHGGIYCVIHESAASIGAVVWLAGKGVAVGTNNSTDFLRQASVGDTITTTATPIHRGRTQQLWRVESVNQHGKLISQGQVRLANLEQEIPVEMVERFAGKISGQDAD